MSGPGFTCSVFVCVWVLVPEWRKPVQQMEPVQFDLGIERRSVTFYIVKDQHSLVFCSSQMTYGEDRSASLVLTKPSLAQPEAT